MSNPRQPGIEKPKLHFITVLLDSEHATVGSMDVFKKWMDDSCHEKAASLMGNSQHFVPNQNFFHLSNLYFPFGLTICVRKPYDVQWPGIAHIHHSMLHVDYN